MATILDANVSVATDSPTYPTTPDGYDPVSLFAYPEYASIDPSADVSTTDLIIYTLAQVDAAQWKNAVDTLRGPLGAAGQTVVAYGVWQQPFEGLQVPSQLCVAGQCFGVPDQVCLPFVGCIPVANQNIVSGFANRLWLLTTSSGNVGAMTARGYVGPFTARGQVAGFAITFELVLLIVTLLLGLPLAIAWIQGIQTGKLTPAQVADQVHSILKAPGENISGPIQSLAIPAIALGATIAIIALVAPNIPFSGSGNVSLPTPIGGKVGAEVSAGRRR